MFRFISSDSLMGFPVTAPPGIPVERLTALRKAFWNTMKDPELLKAVEERKLEIQPTAGEEVQRIVEDLTRTPKEIVDKLKQALAEGEAQAEKKK